MKTFFILGRNPELSRAEIIEYLKARNRSFKEIYFENNILILEVPDNEQFNIQEFGGTIWIGKILFEGNNKELVKYLNNNEIIPQDKFTYSVFGNCDFEILANSFKEKKKKAMLKHGNKKIKFQSKEKNNIPNAEFYLTLIEHNNLVYLGISTQKYDNSDVKDRDMNKPERRESLAISPRLSKILINLSGAKRGILLLDPFCGVGGILQEALIKNIKCYGIDKDKKAIADAEKNLKWIKSNYKINVDYKLECNTSTKAPDLQFGAVATETPLGRLVKKKPSDNEAKKIISNFEGIIIPVLTRLKKVKKPNAKISITFPAIRNFHVDIDKISKKTGLKIYMKPILESRPKQYISRDMLIFQ